VNPLRFSPNSVQPTYVRGKPLSGFPTTGYCWTTHFAFLLSEKIVLKQLKITVYAAGIACPQSKLTVLRTQKNFVRGLRFVRRLYDLFCTRPCDFFRF